MLSPKILLRVAKSLVVRRRPVFAHLTVTERCNLRCRFCRIWRQPVEELGTEDFCKIIDILDRMGIVLVSFTGGEPLLRPDVYDIIDHAKEVGLFTQITSNGTMPLRSYKRLLETGIDRIAISLDRVNGEDLPYSHSSKRIIRTIEYILAHKGKQLFAVSAVLHTENKTDIEKVIEFCQSRGLPVFVQPVVTGDGHLRVNRKEELEGIISSDPVMNPSYFDKAAEEYIKHGRLLWGCLAGEFFFDVKPNGDLWLCHDYPTTLNVLDPDFETKRQSYDFQSARNQCTHGCIYACYYMAQKGTELRNLIASIRAYCRMVSMRQEQTRDRSERHQVRFVG